MIVRGLGLHPPPLVVLARIEEDFFEEAMTGRLAEGLDHGRRPERSIHDQAIHHALVRQLGRRRRAEFVHGLFRKALLSVPRSGIEWKALQGLVSGRNDQARTAPPLMRMIWPVMKPAAS